MTAYYQFVMRLTCPNILDEELTLISTHSLRVYACVLLHEIGKDGPYIKPRLHWLSNCFEVYSRNINRICDQHNNALSGSTRNMVKLALKTIGLDGPVHIKGVINLSMDEIDDKD